MYVKQNIFKQKNFMTHMYGTVADEIYFFNTNHKSNSVETI